jgi:GMP synthase-like glutamine amidotransferase
MINKIIILENDINPEEQILSGVVSKIILDKVECTILGPESAYSYDFGNKMSGIIVGGGLPSVNDKHSWIEREIDFLKKAVALRLPIFGICFGHQLIGKAFGAEIVKRDIRVGFAGIEKSSESPLFDRMPDNWTSAVYHQDRIRELPKGFKLLATSDYCLIQGMQHSFLPIFSVQFHPEIQFGINGVFSNPVPEWGDESRFEKEPNLRIIDNFLKLCLNR